MDQGFEITIPAGIRPEHEAPYVKMLGRLLDETIGEGVPDFQDYVRFLSEHVILDYLGEIASLNNGSIDQVTEERHSLIQQQYETHGMQDCVIMDMAERVLVGNELNFPAYWRYFVLRHFTSRFSMRELRGVHDHVENSLNANIGEENTTLIKRLAQSIGEGMTHVELRDPIKGEVLGLHYSNIANLLFNKNLLCYDPKDFHRRVSFAHSEIGKMLRRFEFIYRYKNPKSTVSRRIADVFAEDMENEEYINFSEDRAAYIQTTYNNWLAEQ